MFWLSSLPFWWQFCPYWWRESCWHWVENLSWITTARNLGRRKSRLNKLTLTSKRCWSRSKLSICKTILANQERKQRNGRKKTGSSQKRWCASVVSYQQEGSSHGLFRISTFQSTIKLGRIRSTIVPVGTLPSFLARPSKVFQQQSSSSLTLFWLRSSKIWAHFRRSIQQSSSSLLPSTIYSSWSSSIWGW